MSEAADNLSETYHDNYANNVIRPSQYSVRLWTRSRIFAVTWWFNVSGLCQQKINHGCKKLDAIFQTWQADTYKNIFRSDLLRSPFCLQRITGTHAFLFFPPKCSFMEEHVSALNDYSMLVSFRLQHQFR